jgi:di/tricarboxylate transporter
MPLSWIELLLVGLTTLALVSNIATPARIFGVFILVVLASGVVPFTRATSLLAEPAIITVTALIVLSAALGKLPALQRLFFARGSTGLRATLGRLLGVSALTSAVAPNTAVVAAVMGPATRRPGVDAHQLLLPLSYASLAGGMITPFGTSASLILVSRAAEQGVSLTVLDFLFPKV